MWMFMFTRDRKSATIDIAKIRFPFLVFLYKISSMWKKTQPLCSITSQFPPTTSKPRSRRRRILYKIVNRELTSTDKRKEGRAGSREGEEEENERERERGERRLGSISTWLRSLPPEEISVEWRCNAVGRRVINASCRWYRVVGRSAWRPVMYGLAAVMEYYYRSASTGGRRGWISGVVDAIPLRGRREMRVSMVRSLPAITTQRSSGSVRDDSSCEVSPSGCSIIETSLGTVEGGWRILTGREIPIG